MSVVDSVLEKRGLKRIHDVRVDDQSAFMFPFNEEGRSICSKYNSDIYFVFIESLEMQAVSIDDEVKICGMYAGMFWMLCRLASVIAGGGVFPAMLGGEEPSWSPDELKLKMTPREILEEGRSFDWDFESVVWKGYPERQMLFYIVLGLLFRFVVFHEIGHLYNKHCDKRRAGAIRMLVDSIGPKIIDPKDAIPSQARELVSDHFAMIRTIELLNQELALKADLNMTKILRERLMPDRSSLVRFALTIICLYFRLSDRSDWQQCAVNTLSHPPAPFRMKALFSALIENPTLGLTEQEASDVIRGVTVQADVVMSVVLNIQPNPHWFDAISTPQHDSHFSTLCREYTKWVDLNGGFSSQVS